MSQIFYIDTSMTAWPKLTDSVEIFKYLLSDNRDTIKFDGIENNTLTFNNGFQDHECAIYSITDKDGTEVLSRLKKVNTNNFLIDADISHLDIDSIELKLPGVKSWTYKQDGDKHIFTHTLNVSVILTQQYTNTTIEVYAYGKAITMQKNIAQNSFKAGFLFSNDLIMLVPLGVNIVVPYGVVISSKTGGVASYDTAFQAMATNKELQPLEGAENIRWGTRGFSISAKPCFIDGVHFDRIYNITNSRDFTTGAGCYLVKDNEAILVNNISGRFLLHA